MACARARVQRKEIPGTGIAKKNSSMDTDTANEIFTQRKKLGHGHGEKTKLGHGHGKQKNGAVLKLWF